MADAAPQFGSNKPPKYDENGGFDLYKAMLQSYLSQREAWKILDGTEVLGNNPSEDETKRFESKNALARDALLRGVLVKDATKICMLTSAREMWMAFEKEKTRSAYSNALYLRKKLYAFTFNKGMDMDKYLDEMETMRRQLRNMNDEISDTGMVKLILQGVAFVYRGVVRNFDKDVRAGNAPSLMEVMNTLRSEAEIDVQRNNSRKKADNGSEDTKLMQVKAQQQSSGGKGKRQWKQNNNGNGKKKFKGKNGDSVETRTCYFCKKPGHLKRDCAEYLEKQRLKKQDENKSNGNASNERQAKSMSLVRWSGAGGGEPSSIGMVEVSDSVPASGQWMIDSGAGVHVCTDWTMFTEMKEDSLTFVSWKGDVSKSEACGRVAISATDATTDGDVMLELEDAQYTSNGTNNLLSLECLEQCGWTPSYSNAVNPEHRAMFLGS